MKVINISVSAGRTFNHPFEQFSNLRSDVEVTAMVHQGEDFEADVKELQGKVERLAEDHKQLMLKSLREAEELSSMQREAFDLQQALKRSQERLEMMRKIHPEVFRAAQLTNGEGEP